MLLVTNYLIEGLSSKPRENYNFENHPQKQCSFTGQGNKPDQSAPSYELHAVTSGSKDNSGWFIRTHINVHLYELKSMYSQKCTSCGNNVPCLYVWNLKYWRNLKQ